jgi:hypothetical protein
MNFEQAQIDILMWITGFVEKPNAALDGWSPCPYARQARLAGEVEIRPGMIDPYTDLMRAELGQDKTVVIYVYNAADIDAHQFNQQIHDVNLGFLLPRDLLALADHPEDPEIVKGVTMNQGTYALAFLQPLTKLNNFAQTIAAKGYYHDWPEDYLAQLFQNRIDPR